VKSLFPVGRESPGRRCRWHPWLFQALAQFLCQELIPRKAVDVIPGTPRRSGRNAVRGSIGELTSVSPLYPLRPKRAEKLVLRRAGTDGRR